MVTTAFPFVFFSRAEKKKCNDDTGGKNTGQNLPLGREESAEVELLPPKMDDIAVDVLVVLLYPFKQQTRNEKRGGESGSFV